LRKAESSQVLSELTAVVRDLGSFLMGMDAKLELIIELLGDEDGEEGNRADS